MSWQNWAQVAVLLSPIIAFMIWWEWRQRVWQRALDKKLAEGHAAFEEWVRGTVRCPACKGVGRVAPYPLHVVDNTRREG